MFLQATVDAPDLVVAQNLIELYEKVPEIDIIEMGAPMVTHYGVKGAEWFISQLKPSGKKLYVDTKLIDFPELELTPFINAGARLFSAAAIMNDTAFEQLSSMVIKHGLTILVTMMGYPLDKVAERVTRLQRLGFPYFIAHGAGATQDEAFADLIEYSAVLSGCPGARVVAAGGINDANVAGLHPFVPLHGVIVGRGIAKADDPVAAAASIKRQLRSL